MSTNISTNTVPTEIIHGDVAIGRNLSVGGDVRLNGGLVIDEGLTVKGWLDVENLAFPLLGVYETVADLEAAQPNPQEGQMAGVFDTRSGSVGLLVNIYLAQNREWVFTHRQVKVTVEAHTEVDDPDHEALVALDARLDDVEEALDDKANVSALASKADASNVYVKSQVYTKTETDGIVENAEKMAGVYGKLLPSPDFAGVLDGTETIYDETDTVLTLADLKDMVYFYTDGSCFVAKVNGLLYYTWQLNLGPMGGSEDVITRGHLFYNEEVGSSWKAIVNKIYVDADGVAYRVIEGVLKKMQVPNSAVVGLNTLLGGKADKISGGTNGNFVSRNAAGNIQDSGYSASSFLTSHQDISGKADKGDLGKAVGEAVRLTFTFTLAGTGGLCTEDAEGVLKLAVIDGVAYSYTQLQSYAHAANSTVEVAYVFEDPTEIPQGVFKGLADVVKIHIPSFVHNIRAAAFGGMGSSIATVECEAMTPPKANSDAFLDTTLTDTTLVVHDLSETLYTATGSYWATTFVTIKIYSAYL